MTQRCSETVVISPVAEPDLDPIARLAREIWYLHYPGIITVRQIDYMLAQRYRPDVISSQIDAREAWWDKIEAGPLLAGFACYEPGSAAQSAKPASVKLDKLYVHPRAQRRGLGYALVEHIETCSRERGFSTLYLQVNKGNSSSIAFYRRAGFEITDHVKVKIGNGFVMDDYVMSKQLADFPG
jgi:GNAT superfamily N-acetyltransferase